MVDPVTIAVGVLIAVVGGGVGLWMARKQWSLRREIKTAESVDAGSLERGVVELEGTAVPADETFTSPLTGQECVAYQYEVEERHRGSGGSHEGRQSRWKTVTDKERAAPFYVDDGTGRALVDAPVADFELQRAYEVDTDDALAGTAGKVLASITGGDTGPDAPVTDERLEEMKRESRRRRYREHLVLPDESVYVYGEVMSADEVPQPGSGISSVVGMLASSGKSDGSILGTAVSAFGGEKRGYRRTKRQGHEQRDFDDVGPSESELREQRAALEDLEGLQGTDPEELSDEERRRLMEMSQEFAGDSEGPMGSIIPSFDELAEAAVDPDGGPLARADRVVSRGDTIGEFVVSDREKGGVLRSYSTSTLKWVAVAVGSLAVGALVAAQGLGVFAFG